MYNMLHMYNRTFLRSITHILGQGRIERLVKSCMGGEKASREFPKCHSKNVQKNGNNIESKINRKPLSWRKLISLASIFILPSISENLRNRLKIRTTGDNPKKFGNRYRSIQSFCRLLLLILLSFSRNSFLMSLLQSQTRTSSYRTPLDCSRGIFRKSF